MLRRLRELLHDGDWRSEAEAVALAAMSGRKTAVDYCPVAIAPRVFAEAVYMVVRAMSDVAGASVIETSPAVVRAYLRVCFDHPGIPESCGERVHLATKIRPIGCTSEVSFLSASASLPASLDDVLSTAARLLPALPF